MAEAWGLLKELYSSSGAAGHYRRGGSPIFLKVFKEEMERGLKRSLIAEWLNGDKAYALHTSL